MWLNFEPTFGVVDPNMTNMTLSALWENASGLNMTVFSPTCDSSWFQPVVGVTSVFYFILSVFAMAPNFLFVYAVGRSKLLHPNVRVLLISLTTSCVLTCISLSLQSVYNFMLLSSGDLKQPITTRACAVMQNLRFTSHHVTLFTLLLLSLERLLSTHKYFFKPFYRNSVTVLICSMLIASWLYAIVFTFYDFMPTRGDQYGLCYCENSLNFAFYDLVIYVVAYVIADITALSGFCLVYKISRSALNDFGINTAHHSLTARFQIWHNIRMIEMLLPSVAVHVGCLFACNCILAACVHLYQTHREGLGLTILQTYYFITVVHSTAHPLICIRQNAHVGKIVVKLLRGRCAKLFLHAHEAAQVGAMEANDHPGGSGRAGGSDSHLTALASQKRKKQPLLRNTVGYRVSPEQHQKLMATIWDTTKQPVDIKNKQLTAKVTKM